MTHQTHTIAESNNFIVLDKNIKAEPTGDSYQSESDLERELIQDLRNQGYEFISVKSQSAMLANVRQQLQNLNGVVFNDSEWRRFTEQYLDNPSDGILDKFDTLTNSITEGLPREIELRQKQYEYYRDLLFSFPKPETASN